MPVLRFVFVPARPSSVADRVADRVAGDVKGLGSFLEIVPISPDCEQDRRAVTTLAARCRSSNSEVSFAGSGLVSELAGRPQRRVLGWLAWPAGLAPDGRAGVDYEACPLGLVTLVAAGPRHTARFSIAWLLVAPDARRKGVATLLVQHALRLAMHHGADRVYAETSTSWPAAVGFWHSVGFEPMG